MNTILLMTAKGAPIAFLLMAQPLAPQRDCILNIGVQDKSTYKSPEGQAILPGRPTEYKCSVTTAKTGTTVTFENQIGWRFTITLRSDSAGNWSATKGQEKLGGVAKGL